MKKLLKNNLKRGRCLPTRKAQALHFPVLEAITGRPWRSTVPSWVYPLASIGGECVRSYDGRGEEEENGNKR